MSKQLKFSASVSLLAMLGFIMTASPALADDLGLTAAPIDALASLYASAVKVDLLALLQPGLQ